MKTDKEIIEGQLKDAEAFWLKQKELFFQGNGNHQLIALAMGNLNELHAKACALGCRDLIK